MGAAACKKTKVSEGKSDNKNITIGVFGLDNAGKTSIVKAINGAPSDNVKPTVSLTTTHVTYPFVVQNERTDKNSTQQRIRLIDVSGERKFRQQSWSDYYDQLHGWVFVMDASEKKRWKENKEIFDDLLDNEKLEKKPILILANKQDKSGAIDDKHELKRKLDMETLKTKYQIELCTALPQDQKNKVDPPIRKGFSWLIRTIEENYIELNYRVAKTKNTPQGQKQIDPPDSDENRYPKRFPTNRITEPPDYSSAINKNKLPSIHTNRTKIRGYSDDDDDDDDDVDERIYSSATNSSLTKKNVLGPSSKTNLSKTPSHIEQPIPFRSTYESFPEEVPWSISSTGKTTKSDDQLPRFYSKPPTGSGTKKKDISPLVYDAKPTSYGSSSKTTYASNDDYDFSRYQTSKLTNRFDQSSLSNNKFPSTTKTATSDSRQNDDYYSRKPTVSKTSKAYDSDDDKYNLNSEYRGSPIKPSNSSRYDNDDDDDDYFPAKSNTRSQNTNSYPSKPTNHSIYDDYGRSSPSKPTIRSSYNANDRPFSSSKSPSRSRFEDDDDDDNDDYSNSNRGGRSTILPKSNYHSSVHDDYQNRNGGSGSRSRFDDDDDNDDEDHHHISSISRSNTGNRFYN